MESYAVLTCMRWMIEKHEPGSPVDSNRQPSSVDSVVPACAMRCWIRFDVRGERRSLAPHQPEVPSWLATLVNVDDARVPMLETAVIHTTMIKDNMTAYSTAVGPSSLVKNRFNFIAKFFISTSDTPGDSEPTLNLFPVTRSDFLSPQKAARCRRLTSLDRRSASHLERRKKLRTRLTHVKLFRSGNLRLFQLLQAQFRKPLPTEGVSMHSTCISAPIGAKKKLPQPQELFGSPSDPTLYAPGSA